MTPKVVFTLDGKSVEAEAGTPVLEAARRAGIEIPHYCYHPALGNPGVCRLCMVEVEGLPKLQASCRLGAKEGLIVRSNSPAARRAQASSLEFHLVNHPLDCPVCDQAGECWLQDYYMGYGLYASRVREDKRHKPKRQDIGEHVMLDSERCILCTRCTRFLDQVPKTGELGIFQRGEEAVLAPYPGVKVDNPYSGNIVDLCPVGALTDKDFRFQVRVWYLDRTPSVCTGCARGCSIEVHTNTRRPWHTEGRRVARLKPRHNPEVNGWWLCDEGRYGYKALEAPSRLFAVSVLEGGRAEGREWGAALAKIAEELSELSRARGPEGLAVVLSATLSNEDLFAARALLRGALAGGPLLLRPGPDQLGEEDAVLRRKEKVPNLRGARALGFAEEEESSWEALRAGVEAGKIWGLYVVDRDPLSVWKTLPEAAVASLPFTLYQGSSANRFSSLSRWVLPACSYVEEDATYVNFQGRVQRARAALKPLGQARADWEIFSDLSSALGSPLGYESAESVFRALCAACPEFSALSWEGLLPHGLALRAVEPKEGVAS